MTYRYRFKPAIKSIEDCTWFNKSYETIEDWGMRDVDDVDRDYEEKFNIKLIYNEVDDTNGVRPIAAIEFPSEDDALMFLLRWN